MWCVVQKSFFSLFYSPFFSLFIDAAGAQSRQGVLSKASSIVVEPLAQSRHPRGIVKLKCSNIKLEGAIFSFYINA